MSHQVSKTTPAPGGGGGGQRVGRKSLTTAEFIARAEAIHGVGTYNYSQVKYTDSRAKVRIICPVHGAFDQKPTGHISAGAGCPACGVINKVRLTPEQYAAYVKGRTVTLYFVKLSGGGEVFYKVGITSRPARYRHRRLELVTGCRCEVLATYLTKDAAAGYAWEQRILEQFAHLRYTPRTSFPGAGECFTSAEEILAVFPK